ncbi:MAG: M2 family metallopeptidase [Planctomycetes bacterium]|nr:M2 family metallopeptidase [Planctomycetota bacterium]
MSTTRFLVPAAALAALVLGSPCAMSAEEIAERARQFVKQYERKIGPLEKAAGQAWWDANLSGKKEDFKTKEETQNRIDEALADPKAFAELKALQDAKKQMDDPVLVRTIDVLYRIYLEKQLDTDLLKKIVAKANAVEKAFNVFRARVDDKEMDDNKVRDVLKRSKDSEHRKAVWEASKQVGSVLESDLKELVKLRNEAAKKLGFKNYHALQLFLNEQDGDGVIKLFDELDRLTKEPFATAKVEIDVELAKRYRIKVDELRPWHYHDPFFQETPSVFSADIDEPFKNADLEKLTADFYRGIGLPVDDVLRQSDLFPKKGKSPHAFCTDIDRSGDNVRVLCNIPKPPNANWAATMLHEFGHSVYSSKNIPARLPYVLRMESHILTTEGVAMMFERLAKKRTFLEKMGLKVAKPDEFDATTAKMERYQLLIFSRWCQVMLRFEKAMYEDPTQDLNKLWWDLVERYQEVKRPEDRNAPDYASKIHIVRAPVYYHNYMMGELFASQVHHAIARELYKDENPDAVIYLGNKDVGDFMKKKVFEPGKTLSWNELTKHATGEGLNAKFFARDFKGK